MNPMQLPKRYAVVQIVEHAVEHRVLLNRRTVIGIEADEEICRSFRFGSLKRARGEGLIQRYAWVRVIHSRRTPCLHDAALWRQRPEPRFTATSAEALVLPIWCVGEGRARDWSWWLDGARLPCRLRWANVTATSHQQASGSSQTHRCTRRRATSPRSGQTDCGQRLPTPLRVQRSDRK